MVDALRLQQGALGQMPLTGEPKRKHRATRRSESKQGKPGAAPKAYRSLNITIAPALAGGRTVYFDHPGPGSLDNDGNPIPDG